MNETAGSVVHDSSGNAFDGTKADNVIWDNGSALFSSPSTSLIQPDNATAVFSTLTTNLTLSLWIKDSGTGDTSQWLFKSNIQGVGSIYADAVKGIWNMGQGNSVTRAWEASDNRQAWHNFTIVRDGVLGTVTLYMDGVQAAVNAGNTAAYPGITEFAIGGKFNSTTVPFEGNMRDFMAYDRVLTGAEAADIYAATVPEPTTIALLSFGALALVRRKK